VKSQSKLSGWRWHLILGALLVVELAVWGATSESDEDLTARAASGEVQERLDALHVLGNRGVPRRVHFTGNKIKRLLADPDPRIQRFALTATVCKFQTPRWQLRRILEGAERADAEWWIDFVIQLRKAGTESVGGGFAMRLQEFEWYCAALDGVDPPRDAVLESCAEELGLVRELLIKDARKQKKREQASKVPR